MLAMPAKMWYKSISWLVFVNLLVCRRRYLGGEGSGRLTERILAGELLMNDDQFKQCVTKETVSNYQTVLTTLMGVITGELEDQVFDSKNGVMVSRKASLADRVKAAKVWKEMTLDKVISDKKSFGEGEQGMLFDFHTIISEVADQVRDRKKVRTAKPALSIAGGQS